VRERYSDMNRLKENLVMEVEGEHCPLLTQMEKVKISEEDADFEGLRQVVNPDYFRECHILCKRGHNSVTEGDVVQIKPLYHNPATDEYFDVENLALRYYSQVEGFHGTHSENALGRTLFGIFFWDVVFYDKIPYVF